MAVSRWGWESAKKSVPAPVRKERESVSSESMVYPASCVGGYTPGFGAYYVCYFGKAEIHNHGQRHKRVRIHHAKLLKSPTRAKQNKTL